MQRSWSVNAVLLLAIFLATFSGYGAEHEQDFDDPDDGVVEIAQDDNHEELIYESPKYNPEDFYFVDPFDNIDESRKRWTKSQAKKDDTAEEIAKYDGKWDWESPQRIVWKNDYGLVLKSKAKHAAIAAPLSKPFTFKQTKPLVVQYEVTMQDGQECGGSYIKLLSEGEHIKDLTKFNDKTPYTIMFGPDKCGNDIKMHFIFRHVNPINGTISEKHSQKPKDRLEEPFKDKLPHLYTLILRPDNTFEVSVDHKVINSGSLLHDFKPPVNPPREIDDPEDKKPKGWDEREKIPDPTAVKPEDWNDEALPQIPDPNAEKPENWLDDEPVMIPDPAAEKPDDWDTEIDGEWEAPLVDNPVCDKVPGCGKWNAPLIPNPEYKGKWRAPLIPNPNYQGKWAPRKIVNPDFFEDLNPFQMTPISAIGLELWSMSSDILFDNFLIGDDIDLAREFAAKTFDIKRKYIDKESETFFSKIMAFINANPWFWQAGLVLFATSFVFLLYRIFGSSGKKEPPKEVDSDKVKTDTKEKQTGLSDENTNEDKENETEKKSSESSLNKSEDADEDEDDEAAEEEKSDESDGAEEEKNSNNSDEKSSDDVEEKEKSTTNKPDDALDELINPVAVRKRRARRDVY